MGSDQNTLKVMAGLAYTLLVRSDRRTGGSSKNSLQRKNQADPQKDPKRSAGEQQVEPPPPFPALWDLDPLSSIVPWEIFQI